jgi:FKBP-type peptidyl-prolyl cis-trans isomerase (trigger factor)
LIASGTLGACDLPGTVPANVAVVVNGTSVPSSRYDHLVEVGKRTFTARGIPFDVNSAGGQAHLKDLQKLAIQGLVHEVVIKMIAQQKKIQVSDQELEQAVKDVADAVGGMEALHRQLDQTGQSDQDFLDQLRLTRLQTKLRNADSSYKSHLEESLKAATVTAYVPPCDQDHEYPRCVGGTP